MTKIPAAYADIFFRGDIDDSRAILTTWYRMTAFGLVLALLISQILYERTSAGPPKPAHEPGQKTLVALRPALGL